MIEFQATYISYMIMGLVGYACGYIICKLRTGYKEDAEIPGWEKVCDKCPHIKNIHEHRKYEMRKVWRNMKYGEKIERNK